MRHYDALNRLTGSDINGAADCSGSPVKAVTYGAPGGGGIATKSDVGTYAYGTRSAGPQAITSIDTTTGCTLLNGCFVNGVTNRISGTTRTAT